MLPLVTVVAVAAAAGLLLWALRRWLPGLGTGRVDEVEQRIADLDRRAQS